MLIEYRCVVLATIRNIRSKRREWFVEQGTMLENRLMY